MQKISFDNLERNVLLEDDEQIIWQEKPSKLEYILEKNSFPLAFVLFWFSFDAIMFLSMVFTTKDIKEFIMFLFFISLHMLPVWIWLGITINLLRELKQVNYCVTNKKIIITDAKTTLKTTFENIKDITFSESKFLKRGTITFATSNNGNIKFAGIKDVTKKYATIRLIIDNAGK